MIEKLIHRILLKVTGNYLFPLSSLDKTEADRYTISWLWHANEETSSAKDFMYLNAQAIIRASQPLLARSFTRDTFRKGGGWYIVIQLWERAVKQAN